MQVDHIWKSHILQAFTEVFKKCDPESSMKLVCLSAIEEMLFPNYSYSEIVDFQITWIREIPLLLTLLGDKNPSVSKAVLRLQLHLGQCAIMNSPLSQELDSMQYSLREFYSTCHDGEIAYGPFMKLDREIQELSVCCLYYFSFLDASLLQSLAACCLCQDLEPRLLFRFLEVLNSAYKAGHIHIADYVSFLVTLLSLYEVFPESSSVAVEKCGKSNSRLFRSVTNDVRSCLSQIGDDRLVFKMLEETVIDQISNKPPLENTCALLRTIVALDSKPSKISEQNISKLGNILPGYLIDVVSSLGAEDSKIRYYVLPCFLLFYGSENVFSKVLSVMASFISGNDSQNISRISGVVGVLVLMHEDVRILSCYKEEIDSLLQKILIVMSDEGSKLKIEEKHRIKCAYDRLKTLTGR